MSTTDAWAFLDIRNPLCAWNVYRGALVAPPADEGFVSVWAAAMLRRAKDGDIGPLLREVALEQVRKSRFSTRVSRLQGLYCFRDQQSAESALAWGESTNHFRPEFVAELSLAEARGIQDSVDSNWISYAAMDSRGAFADPSWIASYWSGTPMPGHTPIWETVAEGRLNVLGTELRERAYESLKRWFPRSLFILETARIAAWAGSDLGNCSGWLHRLEDRPDTLALDYLMDFRDTDNPDFLNRVEKLRKEGHPVRWSDVLPYEGKEIIGATPDLRPLSFELPRALLEPDTKT